MILTHVRPEHALGLRYDGTTRNFPDAEVVVTRIDHRFWTDPAMESRLPQGSRFIEAGRSNIHPHVGRVRTLTMLTGKRILMEGVHVPWPGFGRIMRDTSLGGEGFMHVPRPA